MQMKLNNFCPPQGGDLHCQEHVSAPPPLLLQWVKTDHALVMLFNNDTLQVCIINKTSHGTLSLHNYFFKAAGL